MIRPDLRDLINKHEPIEELNNENNDDNDNNDNSDNNGHNNNDTNHGEQKIQLSIIISCISTKCFNKKRTMHSKSKAVEIYMGSNIEDVINTLFSYTFTKFSERTRNIK